MYYVYVIKSSIDNRLYKGLTKDLNNRIREHNAGKTRSTKPYRPWVLYYYEEHETIFKAREREKYFKSGIGREFLKKMDP